MKKLYLLLLLTGIVLVGCTKRVYYDDNPDPDYWMRTHEKGTVAYVDYYSGNYIIDTYNGYAVIELYGGVAPREYDREYANFSNPGVQTVYNRDAGYFTQIRIIDSWLSWSDAMYLLDDISQ
ncbi:MAG: hypothetical protein EOO02_08480 [Chitinophagaceae bacterium]|nr:MAG: hypothetical protein EOO02_08480 [Chitinophagaceae bacterium]